MEPQFGLEFGAESTFLGEGAFGEVYKAMYGGLRCAVKLQDFEQEFCVYTIQEFQQECLLHSKLHHPNVVKMYGVCYHSDSLDKPMKVMEFVDGGTLSLFLCRHHTIPTYVKLSILQDVSTGLHYLHSQNPPIVHCHINTDIILLTSTLTAKIGSFTFAQEEGGGHINGPSFDVYLLGYIVCRVVTQLTFGHLYQYIVDPHSDRLCVACNFEPRQRYLSAMSEGPLKQLAVRCLHNDVKRPSILHVCEVIDEMIKGQLSTRYIMIVPTLILQLYALEKIRIYLSQQIILRDIPSFTNNLGLPCTHIPLCGNSI